MLDSIPPVPGSSAPAEGELPAQRRALDDAFGAFLRDRYVVRASRSELLPAASARWSAQQLRMDNAARAWGGGRVDIPWHRPGHELYGVWSTPEPAVLVGMAMSKQAVDDAGRHLLSYYQLEPRSGD